MKKDIIVTGKNIQISDGYHTFEELYEHRIQLFISLCSSLVNIWAETDGDKNNFPVWRSRFHADGSKYRGWFIMGIFKEKGEQITYHLPVNRWEDTYFAETLKKAPKFDGHTSKDVLNRLKIL